MSDEALRRVERGLAADPQSVELRRKHARVLSQVGRKDEALAALDLAWRLGADDVWDDLNDRLVSRRLEIGPMTFGYVPGGPFVMGSDTFDEDASPPHLVELSPFYISAVPVFWGALDGWEHYPIHWRQAGSEQHQRRWNQAACRTNDFSRVQDVVAFFNATHAPRALAGTFQLASESQWERSFRAGLLRPDGESPYGVQRGDHPEWTRDHYASNFYERSPRVDPVAEGASGDLYAVRGVSAPGVSHYPVFREAAREDGAFPVGGSFLTRRWVQYEGGLGIRLVFTPSG